ncbi:MAG: hypothetical protein ACRD4S_12695 [Candidatus Acidiferrales bacterium]
MATLESIEHDLRVLAETISHLVNAIEQLAEQLQKKPLDFSSIAGHVQHSDAH